MSYTVSWVTNNVASCRTYNYDTTITYYDYCILFLFILYYSLLFDYSILFQSIVHWLLLSYCCHSKARRWASLLCSGLCGEGWRPWRQPPWPKKNVTREARTSYNQPGTSWLFRVARCSTCPVGYFNHDSVWSAVTMQSQLEPDRPAWFGGYGTHKSQRRALDDSGFYLTTQI